VTKKTYLGREGADDNDAVRRTRSLLFLLFSRIPHEDLISWLPAKYVSRDTKLRPVSCGTDNENAIDEWTPTAAKDIKDRVTTCTEVVDMIKVDF